MSFFDCLNDSQALDVQYAPVFSVFVGEMTGRLAKDGIKDFEKFMEKIGKFVWQVRDRCLTCDLFCDVFVKKTCLDWTTESVLDPPIVA